MALIDTHVSLRSGKPRSFRAALLTRLAVWRSRRDLAKLDARQLEDVGISTLDAAREVKLSLWDVPHTWRDQ